MPIPPPPPRGRSIPPYTGNNPTTPPKRVRVWANLAVAAGPADGISLSFLAGMPLSYREQGPLMLPMFAARAKQRFPDLEGIMVEDPFGKHMYPPYGWSILLDQRSRSLAMGEPMKQVTSLQRLQAAKVILDDMGIKLRMYLGAPPEGMDREGFIREILPLAKLGIGFWIDGNAQRESTHFWMQQVGKSWGCPFVGIEDLAPLDSHLNNKDTPAFFTGYAWRTNNPLRGKDPRKNPGTYQWRGTKQLIDGTAAEAVQACRLNDYELCFAAAVDDTDANGMRDIELIKAEIAHPTQPPPPIVVVPDPTDA